MATKQQQTSITTGKPVESYDSRALPLPKIAKEKPLDRKPLPKVKPRRPFVDSESNPVRAETAELPKRSTTKQIPTRYPRRGQVKTPTVANPV